MNVEIKTEDRRREKRYSMEKDTYAIIDHGETRLGHIIDISKGGMAFSYLGNEPLSHKDVEVDLFMYQNNYYVDTIPAQIVANFEMPSTFYVRTIAMMRCCLQFKELSQKKRSELDFLLKNYVIDP